MADLPDDSIYLDLLDQVLSMEEKSVPAIDQGQIISAPNQTVLAEPVFNKNDPVVEAPVSLVPDEKPKVNKLARELNRIGNQFKQVASAFKWMYLIYQTFSNKIDCIY